MKTIKIIAVATILLVHFASLASYAQPPKTAKETSNELTKLVNVYIDSIKNFRRTPEYLDFGEVLLEKWGECSFTHKINLDAVAATIAFEEQLDGAYSESVSYFMYDIMDKDSSQFDVLASILNLEESQKYHHVANNLATLFFYEALYREMDKNRNINNSTIYIDNLYRKFPNFASFIKKAGMQIEIKDNAIIINGNEWGEPSNIY